MDDLRKSITTSLDGQSDEIFSYLPYLLQDLWEIGASSDDIIVLLEKHQLQQMPQPKVLDLGCGKGAVSIRLAKAFGCQVTGIDAMPEFIEDAQKWAKKYQVKHLCRFEVGDIRQRIESLRDFDIAILGSIGPVLGDVEQTLTQVKTCIKPGGYILLDDGYLKNGSSLKSGVYLQRDEVLAQIRRSGMKLVDEHVLDDDFVEESDRDIFASIKQRADELIRQYPDKRSLFEGYLECQERENEILEYELVCVTWLLKMGESSKKMFNM